MYDRGRDASDRASQVRLVTPAGAARVDFLVDGLVVVEFDGAVKYDGINGRNALVREKQRESALVDLGLEVVRVVWSDLTDTALLATRINAARTPARARSRAA